jgi:hypothetical protein
MFVMVVVALQREFTLPTLGVLLHHSCMLVPTETCEFFSATSRTHDILLHSLGIPDALISYFLFSKIFQI